MAYNKKILSDIINKATKAKVISKPKDIDYNSKMGYRDDSPFRNKSSIDINTPNGTIDMSNTGKPLLANGRYLPPYSGTHQFNTNVVTEQPLQAKRGGLVRMPKPTKQGLASKKYSRSLSATNKLFTENALFKKQRSKKRKVFDPNAKYYQDGGINKLEGDLISKVLMERNRGTDFVDRAYALGDNPGTPMFNLPDDEQFGQNMSHKMAWGEDDNGQAYMYPTIMNPNNEAIQVPNQYADYISSEGYKNATGMNYQDGGFVIDLSPEEIEEYKRGGYIVEELPEMQPGGSFKPGKGYKTPTLSKDQVSTIKKEVAKAKPVAAKKPVAKKPSTSSFADRAAQVEKENKLKGIENKAVDEATYIAGRDRYNKEQLLAALDGIGEITGINSAIRTGERIIDDPLKFAGDLTTGISQVPETLVEGAMTAGSYLFGDNKNYVDVDTDALGVAGDVVGALPVIGAAGKVIRPLLKSGLKNAYKINPYALKENPEMYVYRARPVGQNPDMNMAATLKAKEAAGEPLTWVQKNIIKMSEGTVPDMGGIAAREKYYGRWFDNDPKNLEFYINPDTRNFADNDAIEILRSKLPRTEADKLKVSQFEDAKSLSGFPERELILPIDKINAAERFPESSLQQLIQEDKAFNTPHWLRGYGSKRAKQLPGSPNAASSVDDVGKAIASSKPSGSGNVVKSGLPNPLAIADRIIPRPPLPTSFLGIEDSWNYYSPLNLIPGYGKKLVDKTSGYPNFVGFRKFGNSIDDVIESQSLRPKGGKRMGAEQIAKEGNWAESGKPNENYQGVFEATMNPQIPGSNIKLEKLNKRNGIVGTTKEGDVAIPLTDPGLSFNRRLPFSNKYVPIDKQKLIEKKFQLATQLPHVQSLIEKYGLWAGVAFTSGYMVGGKEQALENLKTINKYSVDPIINWSKEQWEGFEKTINSSLTGLGAGAATYGTSENNTEPQNYKEGGQMSPKDLDPATLEKYLSDLRVLENSIKKGYKNNKWYPHSSIEGGANTIAYGHKLMPGESFSSGLTEQQARDLQKKDVLAHQVKAEKYVDDKYGKGSYDKLPQNSQMLLTDYAYNLGSLNKFPSFVEGVFKGDKNKMLQQYERTGLNERNKWTKDIINTTDFSKDSDEGFDWFNPGSWFNKKNGGAIEIDIKNEKDLKEYINKGYIIEEL